MQNRTGENFTEADSYTVRPVARSAAVVIAVTLQRLAEDATRFWSIEEQLVLQALRRSATRLNNASVQELAHYVKALSPNQLRGVTSNVKGIYHELLFVNAENINGDEITARVFEATNHPGADVEFLVDGDVISAVQLKAVASPEAILEHLRRYPDIDIRATSEIATEFPNISSSGFSSEALADDLNDVFSNLPGDDIMLDAAEGLATGGLVGVALVAGQAIKNRKFSAKSASSILGDAAVGGVAAIALDNLLDGLL